MDELISRKALSDRLKDLDEWCQDERKPGIEQARCMVHEAPTVDAEVVRRCRDCENRGTDDCPLRYAVDYGIGNDYPQDDDFCSRWSAMYAQEVPHD